MNEYKRYLIFAENELMKIDWLLFHDFGNRAFFKNKKLDNYITIEIFLSENNSPMIKISNYISFIKGIELSQTLEFTDNSINEIKDIVTAITGYLDVIRSKPLHFFSGDGNLHYYTNSELKKLKRHEPIHSLHKGIR